MERDTRASDRIAPQLHNLLLWLALAIIFVLVWILPIVIEMWRYGFSVDAIVWWWYVPVVFLCAFLIWALWQARVILILPRLTPPLIYNFQELTSPEQINIIQEIFWKYKKVKLIRRFSGGYQNSGVYRVGLEPAGGGPSPVDCVLKFGKSGKLKKELNNYNVFIHANIANRAGTPDLNRCPADEEALGVVQYKLTQMKQKNKLDSFGVFYSENDADTVGRIIEEIFDEEHLGCLHKASRKDWPISQQYSRLLDNQVKIADAVQKLALATSLHWPKIADLADPKLDAVLPNDDRTQLRNPLEWVKTEFKNGLVGKEGLICDVGIKHGDLQSENILIEKFPQGDRLIWLIDFAYTGEGAVVEDFCRLEAEIKFCLAKLNGLTSDLWNFEKRLLAAKINAELALETDSPSANSEFSKAWSSIRTIRRLAVKLPHLSPFQYYLGLLHSTLPTVYYYEREKWQKEYAFISAALICNRLDHLTKA